MNNERSNPMKYLTCICGIIIIIWFLGSTIITIPAGERGVLLTWGKPSDVVMGEGLHFVVPVMHSVVWMDVRTLKYEVMATSASKDLQDTKTTIALNYHITSESANKIYQEIGMNYADKIIAPAIQEVVKASTAQFNAEELITQRAKVKDMIDAKLYERLLDKNIIVETVSITNFEFSNQFSEAIENKVTAQQKALQAENDLKRIEVEARQRVAQAEGQSKAIEIINEQLKRSPEYIKYMATEKWNGILPLVVGGESIPMIQLPMHNMSSSI